MTSEQTLKQKRQYYHQLLIAAGEAAYKDVIVSARFDVDSTRKLDEWQLDELIQDAKHRMYNKKRPGPNVDDDKKIKTWRNRCLLVLSQRGITATPKDWSAINNELAKKQYQWITSPAQLEKGFVNQKGLYAFNTVADLKKLFNQLSAIRDNEKIRATKELDLAFKN
jgi:hypothetical protein